MNRRRFLKNNIKACASTLILESLTQKAFAQSSLINALTNSQTDRVLVLVQLNGGNDGLNTVLPLDQYTNLSAARSNILIPDNKALLLQGASNTGLHPSLGGIQNLYNGKMASIVQGVSYPNPNFSHFRATDIWVSGSDSNQVLSTGIGGRYLTEEFPNFPTGYPNTSMPDPLAIQIGSSVSLFLQSSGGSTGVAITDPSKFYQIVNGVVDPAPNTPAGHELTYLRQVGQQTQAYTQAIKTAASAGSNASTKYPTTSPENKLSESLKIVAKLIKGGLKTKIYIVSLGGFDTHSAQVDSTDKVKGTHADLLNTVSLGIDSFMDDLILLGIEKKVVGMVFSEFGRRIKSNASEGTDHGAGAPVILFGEPLKGGMYGSNPEIPANSTTSDNVPMQHDFRSIYASIMKDWFGLSSTQLQNTMLNQYPILDLFKKSVVSIDDTEAQNKITNIHPIYPNPVIDNCIIPITTNGEHLQLSLYTLEGKKIDTILDSAPKAGKHEIYFERRNIPSGSYIIELRSNSGKYTTSILIL